MTASMIGIECLETQEKRVLLIRAGEWLDTYTKPDSTLWKSCAVTIRVTAEEMKEYK